MSATRLHLAAMDGDEAAVNRLLAEGADVNAKTQKDETPLLFAALSGNVHITSKLLEHGADVTVVPTEGPSPVRIAIRGGHADVVRLLMAQGADVHIEPAPVVVTDEDRKKAQDWVKDALSRASAELRSSRLGRTVADSVSGESAEYLKGIQHEAKRLDSGDRILMQALNSGSVETLRVLLEAGVKPASSPASGTSISPLGFAQRLPNGLDMAKLLLEYGADPNSGADNSSLSPLASAVVAGNIPFAKLLIDSGAHTESDRAGTGLLYLAVLRNDQKMIDFLMERNIGMNDKSVEIHLQNGNDPELKARIDERKGIYWLSFVEAGDVVQVGAVVSSGADVNTVDKKKGSALMIAAEKGNEAMVRLLLSAGADSNLASRYGVTPLHNAARAGASGVIDALLEFGANIAAETTWGATPLEWAAANQRADAADRLIRAGAKMSVVDAVFLRRSEVALEFWNRGVPVAYANKSGTTALHAAAAIGDLAMIEWLLEQGADIGVANKGKQSPLQFAVYSQNNDAVRLLLDRGAASVPKAPSESDPLFSAVTVRNEPIVRLLLERGASARPEVSTDTVSVSNFRMAPSPWLMVAHQGQVKSLASGELKEESERTWAVLRTLIEFGADVNAEGAGMDSLLASVIEADAPINVIRLVVETGADVNAQKPLHRAPLVAAVRKERADVVEALLRAGADPNIGSGSDNPLAVAKDRNLFAISGLLEQYGAVEPTPQEGSFGLGDLSKLLIRGSGDAARHPLAAMAQINFGAILDRGKSVRDDRIAERRAKLEVEVLETESRP